MGGSGDGAREGGFRTGGGASSPARATAEVLRSPFGSRPELARELLPTLLLPSPRSRASRERGLEGRGKVPD